jgi:hypothetical protein
MMVEEIMPHTRGAKPGQQVNIRGWRKGFVAKEID